MGHTNLKMIHERYYSYIKNYQRDDGAAFMKNVYAPAVNCTSKNNGAEVIENATSVKSGPKGEAKCITYLSVWYYRLFCTKKWWRLRESNPSVS